MIYYIQDYNQNEIMEIEQFMKWNKWNSNKKNGV